MKIKLSKTILGFISRYIEIHNKGKMMTGTEATELASLQGKITHNIASDVKLQSCKHKDWSYKEHGRRCFECGKLMVDFGD